MRRKKIRVKENYEGSIDSGKNCAHTFSIQTHQLVSALKLQTMMLYFNSSTVKWNVINIVTQSWFGKV